MNFRRDFQKDDYPTHCFEMDSRPPLGEAEGFRGNDRDLCLYWCDSALICVIRDPSFLFFLVAALLRRVLCLCGENRFWL